MGRRTPLLFPAAFQAGSEVWGELGTGPREWGCTLDSQRDFWRQEAGWRGPQLDQEGLRVCAEKERLGHLYPALLCLESRKLGGQRAEVGRGGWAVDTGGTPRGQGWPAPESP